MRHNIQYSENEKLNEIFDSLVLYKNKYKLIWCDTCDRAAIVCIECNNVSCNGSGCEVCISDSDFVDFNKNVVRVEEYLTPDEMKTYIKIETIRKHIINSLSLGEQKIDFKRLVSEDLLSDMQVDAISDLL